MRPGKMERQEKAQNKALTRKLKQRRLAKRKYYELLTDDGVFASSGNHFHGARKRVANTATAVMVPRENLKAKLIKKTAP